MARELAGAALISDGVRRLGVLRRQRLACGDMRHVFVSGNSDRVVAGRNGLSWARLDGPASRVTKPSAHFAPFEREFSVERCPRVAKELRGVAVRGVGSGGRPEFAEAGDGYGLRAGALVPILRAEPGAAGVEPLGRK